MPFVFLSNGEEVRFLDRETDAHARKIAGFHAQDDLQRRIAARKNRRDLSTAEIERKCCLAHSPRARFPDNFAH